MATTKTHPDFSRTPTLTAEQAAWLRRAGIEAKPGDRGYGTFYFKGDAWIEPIPANATQVYLMVRDDHEDGDGARSLGTFPRLRDALRALAAR